MKRFKGLIKEHIYVVYDKKERKIKLFRLNDIYSSDLKKEEIVIRSKSIITFTFDNNTVEYSQDVFERFFLLKRTEVIFKEATKEQIDCLKFCEEKNKFSLTNVSINLYQEGRKIFGKKEEETITILDKTFSLYLTQEQIEFRIDDLAQSINNSLNFKKPPVFLIVLKGGFMFASELLKRLKRECEIYFITASSYKGTERLSTVVLSEINGFGLTGKDIYIVEDIVDSGNTLKTIIEKLETFNVSSVKILTLFDKPSEHETCFTNISSCFKIPDNFIVGYGLDYNQFGRNLTNIYKLKDEESNLLY